MHQAFDVVHVYLNVLGIFSMNWISGNIYFTFIVTPNYYGWIKCKSKFPKNTLQPHTLCSCIHYYYILDLSWWKEYSVLFLNLKSYGTIWNNEYIIWSKLRVSGIYIPIWINKSNLFYWRTSNIVYPEVFGSLHIIQDPFGILEMDWMRLLHIYLKNNYCISQIRSRVC